LKLPTQTKDFWLQQVWGRLCLDPTQEFKDSSWGPNSSKYFVFLCSCGRSVERQFKQVLRGSKNCNCGACDNKPKDYWLDQRWERLRLNPEQELPSSWTKGTRNPYNFLCNCGNNRDFPFRRVALEHKGKTISCGQCNVLVKEDFLNSSWGKLKLDFSLAPPTWRIGSAVPMLCDCGNKTSPIFNDVAKGMTKSCGSCGYTWLSKEMFEGVKWGKLSLDLGYPDFPTRWRSKEVVPLVCDCGNRTSPIFHDIITGMTKSCGCLQVGKDKSHSTAGVIHQWMASLGLEPQWEYPIKQGSRSKFDIYLPDHKVAIEYHGLIWHSERYNKKPLKDHQKYLAALEQGIALIQIYQDEWETNPELVKDLILTACGIKSKASRSHPSYCLLPGTTQEQNLFLQQHHYLGRSGGCLVVEAKHKDQLVGVWVFKRLSETKVEWLRACWHRDFKAWNPHSKALQLAIPELQKMGFTEIISFSDNRLHTGRLYQQLGFRLDGEVKPGYQYTNFKVRRHRSKFMVPAGTDERSVAAEQGWYRIWDSGKKRWLLKLDVT
jgi:predicted SprT family Zn-dependent metalloprotease